jgi:hypothetical protein
MQTSQTTLEPTSSRELSPFIEPLASYICAAERPREVLLSVLSALFDEVQGTHRATLMHMAANRIDSLGLAC